VSALPGSSPLLLPVSPVSPAPRCCLRRTAVRAYAASSPSLPTSNSHSAVSPSRPPPIAPCPLPRLVQNAIPVCARLLSRSIAAPPPQRAFLLVSALFAVPTARFLCPLFCDDAGDALRACEGTTLGACEGTTLGACDGTKLGACDGTTLGACEGDTLRASFRDTRSYVGRLRGDLLPVSVSVSRLQPPPSIADPMRVCAQVRRGWGVRADRCVRPAGHGRLRRRHGRVRGEHVRRWGHGQHVRRGDEQHVRRHE
jgi:hypothetical protein